MGYFKTKNFSKENRKRLSIPFMGYTSIKAYDGYDGKYIFQFPLWDTKKVYKSSLSVIFLSIPFMGYKWGDYNYNKFSRDFQFPLWDT